jgi:hypothetical protein
MRKIIAILIAMAMACVFAPMVGAGPSDTIVVTLDPAATIDISVTPATWAPVAGLGLTNDSGTTYFTIDTLTTDVNISIDVNCSNTASWTIGGTAAHNVFKLGIYPDGGSETALTNTPTEKWGDVSPGTDPQFGLCLDMPLTSSTSVSQTATVTITATALA